MLAVLEEKASKLRRNGPVAVHCHPPLNHMTETDTIGHGVPLQTMLTMQRAGSVRSWMSGRNGRLGGEGESSVGAMLGGARVGRVGGAGRLLQNGDQGTKVGGNKREKLQILASRLAAVVCKGQCCRVVLEPWELC